MHVLEFYTYTPGLVLIFCVLFPGWVLGRITERKSAIRLACWKHTIHVCVFVRFVVMSQAKRYQINVQSVEQQKINLKLLEVEITHQGIHLFKKKVHLS